MTLSPPATAQSSSAPTLSVDAAASRNAINPDIYGIASYGLDASFAQEIQVPNVRWGGDGTSRYNWMVDSSNAGFDWYFIGGNGSAGAVPGASADLMINTYKPANAHALMTIPIIPYVNKSSAWSCSFPVSVYGAQQSTNPYVFPTGANGMPETCGNSLAAGSGTQLIDNDILANHIANTTQLQQGWVQHMVSTFGTAADGGVKYYQLDNEPLGWGNTHRDVLPSGATYATVAGTPGIVALGQQYAAAIKQIDAAALVFGPSDFTLGGWVGTASQQGGLWAGQYYLQQMAAYDAQHGQRLLDYFDEHYYFNTSTPAAQLASTRTLWDPTYNGGTWVEQYDFNGPMMLIPRFKSWITQYYPGTQLSLSEYSIDSGAKTVVDAIAEMDVLGIFGREQLDFANMWNAPAATDPIAYAFRMFRNYDGSGHQFGDVSISAVSSNQGALSIYAAQRSSDQAITVLVINKTTASIGSTITFANVNLPSSAQVYGYSASNLTAITPAASTAVANGNLSYTFPSYSAVMFVVQPGPATTTSTITASASAVTAGQSVSFTVKVAASSGGSPSGSVSLNDGSAALATAALVNGAATFKIGTLTVGTHMLTAAYAGNSADAASTSASVTVQVAAAPLATSTLLRLSSATATQGQPLTLTASVSGATAAAPSGSVEFMDGGTKLTSVPLVSGSASLNVSTLGVGSHSLAAVYSGDIADLASTSAAQTVAITAAVPTADYALALSSSTLSANQSQPAALTVTVTPENGFAKSVSFACSGLPAGWNCSFAPATVTGTAKQSTTLTVSAAQAARLRTPTGMLLAMVLPLPLLLVGAAGQARRRSRWLWLAIIVASVTGCGGDSDVTSSSNTQSAQAKSYSVTVTASAASAPSHTANFMLTVTG